MEQSFGTRIFRGFVLTASAATFQSFLQFFSLIVLARLLAPEVFGIVYPLSAVVMIITGFFTAGIEQALVQRSTIDEDTDRAAIQVLFLGTTAAFFALNFSAVFWFADDAKSTSATVFHILSLLLPLHAARAYVHGRLSQELHFRKLAVLTTMTNVLFVCTAIVLALMLRDPIALAVPMVAQWLVYIPFCGRVPRRLFQRPPPVTTFVDLMRFGGPMTGATISLNIVHQVDQVASGLHSPTMAGIYNRASMLAMIPGRISNMIAQQLGLAALSKLRERQTRLANAYRRGTVLLGVMGLPATAFMLYDARLLIECIIGSQWLAGTTVFVLIALTVHTRILRKMPAWVIVGTGHAVAYFYCELAFAVVKIILCFSFGIISIELLAWSVLIAHLAEFVLLISVAQRYVDVTVGALLRAHMGGAFLACILIGVLVVVDWFMFVESHAAWLVLATHISIGGLIVGGVLISGLLKVVDEDHRWVCGQVDSTVGAVSRKIMTRWSVPPSGEPR